MARGAIREAQPAVLPVGRRQREQLPDAALRSAERQRSGPAA
jgi:hypothetical protein